jgi:hypothetical protein
VRRGWLSAAVHNRSEIGKVAVDGTRIAG